MNNPCENCIHKDEVCLQLEFPCLEYQPKEEKEGEKNYGKF